MRVSDLPTDIADHLCDITVRSEGGAECRKIQKEMKPPGEELDVAGMTMKPDPDDNNWNGSVVL